MDKNNLLVVIVYESGDKPKASYTFDNVKLAKDFWTYHADQGTPCAIMFATAHNPPVPQPKLL